MKQKEMEQESLSRATGNLSTMNYLPIIEGFMEKGISADDIIPRENVLTFHAWKALGRVVKKGEHGVKVVTFVKGGNEEKPKSYPKTTTVFHISQTEVMDVRSDTD
jgi:hypothetical protein